MRYRVRAGVWTCSQLEPNAECDRNLQLMFCDRHSLYFSQLGVAGDEQGQGKLPLGRVSLPQVAGEARTSQPAG